MPMPPAAAAIAPDEEEEDEEDEEEADNGGSPDGVSEGDCEGGEGDCVVVTYAQIYTLREDP
jgi:hypothetical protein